MLPDILAARPSESAVRVAVVYPSLLGTYADRGNAVVLRQRCRWRGIDCEVLEVDPGDVVPEQADLYLLGGAEDAVQQVAAGLLRDQHVLKRIASRASPLLAVCAGYQLLGESVTDQRGARVPGLGLLNVATYPGTTRAVGHLRAPECTLTGVPELLGFENHRGRTVLGPACRPLARTRHGTGNGDGTEGALQGRVVATYAHGPVLALNPALADTLLAWVTGPLAPIPDELTFRARSLLIRRAARRRRRLVRG